MSEKNISVRLYREGDENEIVRLFGKVFDREMTIGEWRWKYLGRENRRVYSSIVVNDETGEVSAHYGGVLHRMVNRGKDIYGLSIGDVMVHPKFRGLRLFKRVASLLPEAAAEDGIIMGYGFPNERAMRLPEKLGLYEKVEELKEGLKDAEFHKGIDRYLYKLFPLQYSDERIDRLWKSVREDYTLFVVRDRRYLVWRYKNHPLFTYELWGLKSRAGSELKGLAVMKREGEQILIIDFICPGKVLGTLLRKMENYAYVSGVKTLKLWAPPFLEDKLRAFGFSVRNAAISIPRTTHEKFLKKDDIEGSFFYTMGDTDFL